MLAAAFMQVLNAAQTRPMVIKRETFSVVVKMNYLLRQIKQHVSLTLFAITAGCEPLEIVVTFLAVLELVRAHKVTCVQTAPFGDVVLRLAAKESPVRLLESA